MTDRKYVPPSAPLTPVEKEAIDAARKAECIARNTTVVQWWLGLSDEVPGRRSYAVVAKTRYALLALLRSGMQEVDDQSVPTLYAEVVAVHVACGAPASNQTATE